MGTFNPAKPDSATAPDVPTGEQVQHVETAVKDVQAAVEHPTAATVETAAADALSVAADVPSIIEETRRGYKTTEFWSVVVAGAADLGLPVDDKIKGLITILAIGYSVARGFAKNGVPNVTPVLPT